MRCPWLAASIVLCLTGAAAADPAPVDPGAFKTSAKFSVGDVVMSLSSAVATIEARAGAPGYSWLRIYFYSFPLDAEDIAGAAKGNLRSMERKQLALDAREYNRSHAFIQLTVDKNAKVWQVDMAIPGRACTIAPFEPEVANFLQDYRFDGRTLRLRSRGSYVCDMKFMNGPDQTFAWTIDLDVPVFAKAN